MSKKRFVLTVLTPVALIQKGRKSLTDGTFTSIFPISKRQPASFVREGLQIWIPQTNPQ